MAELADALDLGSNAQKACRFKSCSRHHLEALFAEIGNPAQPLVSPTRRFLLNLTS
jgi:hypothetical protein